MRPIRTPLLLASWFALWLGAGCGARPVLVDTGEGRDYRLVFQEQGVLSRPVELYGRIEFDAGDALWVHLTGSGGDFAANVAKRWAQELNRRRRDTAKLQGAALVLQRVTRLELQESMRGLKLEDVGPSP